MSSHQEMNCEVLQSIMSLFFEPWFRVVSFSLQLCQKFISFASVLLFSSFLLVVCDTGC